MYFDHDDGASGIRMPHPVVGTTSNRQCFWHCLRHAYTFWLSPSVCEMHQVQLKCISATKSLNALYIIILGSVYDLYSRAH
jgi:hypothetical protein